MDISHLPYDANETSDSRWYHEHYWKERALELLLKHVTTPQGMQLLDFGCGRGEFLAMAAQAGFQVTGLDMDPHCVELARRYGEARLTDPDAYLADMPDACTDVSACFHVLEHVENPKRLLSALRRVTRSYVLIAVPNLRCFQKWNQRKPGIVNAGHLQGWDRETLRNLAETHCGLKLVAFTTDMTIMPSLSSRIERVCGPTVAKQFNLKVLSCLWPLRCTSIIALLRVPEATESA